MDNTKNMQIEVIYASADGQYQVILKLPVGTTARAAIELSGLLEKFPEIDLAHQCIGVYGNRVKPSHVLDDGQRLEIYRSLIRDPKQARRERAAHGKPKSNSVS
jgi:uncharacterized protein